MLQTSFDGAEDSLKRLLEPLDLDLSTFDVLVEGERFGQSGQGGGAVSKPATRSHSEMAVPLASLQALLVTEEARLKLLQSAVDLLQLSGALEGLALVRTLVVAR